MTVLQRHVGDRLEDEDVLLRAFVALVSDLSKLIERRLVLEDDRCAADGENLHQTKVASGQAKGAVEGVHVLLQHLRTLHVADVVDGQRQGHVGAPFRSEVDRVHTDACGHAIANAHASEKALQIPPPRGKHIIQYLRVKVNGALLGAVGKIQYRLFLVFVHRELSIKLLHELQGNRDHDKHGGASDREGRETSHSLNDVWQHCDSSKEQCANQRNAIH